MPTHKVLTTIAGLATIALAASMVPGATATAARAAEPDTVDLLSASDGPTRTAALDSERSRSVDVDERGLASLDAGDRLAIDLFDGASVTAVIDQHRTFDHTSTWTGSLDGEEGTFTAVEVAGVRHITIASTEEGTYEVSSTKGGDYVLAEATTPPEGGDDAIVPDAAVPGRSAPDARTQPGSATRSGESPVSGDAASVIDVAIVYPAALVTQLGAGPLQAQMAQGIAQANQAFANSGIPTQLRLVGTRQVAAAQLSTLNLNLVALRQPGDGVFDEAQALREETHADLVSIWLAGSDPAGQFCGLGYLGGFNKPEVDATTAAWTALYVQGCATANYTFAHEIGHNLSADHDAGASSPPIAGGKPYAKGYVDVAGGAYTVMAYPSACTSAGITCTRVVNFSNPGLVVNGRPQGVADTINTQAIIEQIDAVANYRQSQIYPGAVAVGGRVRYKGVATAGTTPWAPAVALSYQWVRDGVAVAGATSSTFKLSRKDIGHSLAVAVTGSAPYYAPVAAGSAAVVVGKAQFKTKRPKLRGVPRAGRVLSVKVKGWKPKPSKKSVKVRYQWLKNGKKIKGAKKSTYRVRAKDRGKKISVKVTVKKKSYEKARRSSKKVKIRR